MKKCLITTAMLVSFLQMGLAQQDLILKRDGSELKATIVEVANQLTTYKPSDSPTAEELLIDNADIYMIKFGERGNLFFYESGDYFFGDGDGKLPADATIIYLAEGKEVEAYDVVTDNMNIRYYGSKKRRDLLSLSRSEVFMIKRPGGASEIVNQFSPLVIPDTKADPQLKADTDEMELIKAQTPRDAIIKTQKNLNINVSVMYENEEFVLYYKKNAPKGPLYRLDKSRIKTLTYLRGRRRR